MRTSLSHPLQIAAVPAGAGHGLIGLTLCPGKKQSHAASGAWDRDLMLDLEVIAAWNAAAVVTLVEDHELERLQVTRLGQAVQEQHMAWHHLPLRDGSIPGPAFEAAWLEAGAGLRAILRDGSNVLLHCKRAAGSISSEADGAAAAAAPGAAAIATGAAAETPHFSSSILDSSAASRTDRAERSSTILARSAI